MQQSEDLCSIDEGYFAGYSKYDVHEEMLNDKIRCEKYREAIKKVVKEKTLLDIGCGSGILSVYAVLAGAKNVTAVDKANVGQYMTETFNEYGVQDKVKFINETIEDLIFNEHNKPKRFDVIVSEWMGYFLLFENMIRSVLIARQNFLKPEGIMIPSHANMYLTVASIDCKSLQGVQDIHLAGNRKQVFIGCCPKNSLLQVEHTNIQTIDFTMNAQKNPLEGAGFTSKFEIQIAEAVTITAFVGWFDVTLCEGIVLSTSPEEPETHWKQSIFFLDKPIKVKVGDIIEGSISLSTPKDNQRNMIADITSKVAKQKSKVLKDYFTFE